MFDWEPDILFLSLLHALTFSNESKNLWNNLPAFCFLGEAEVSSWAVWKVWNTFKSSVSCWNRKPETNWACLLSEGFVWAANQTLSSTKRKAFCTVSREVVRSIISGWSWRSSAHQLPNYTHTHTHKFTQTHIHMHTHTALHYSQVNTSHILWPKEQLGSQTSSNLVLNSAAETKISVVFTKVGPRCFLKSLSTTSESSLQSALFAVLEWNAWFKLEMERKTNWRWGDAGNGTRVGTSVWISGQVLLWRPERGDGRWQAWHRAIRHASGSLHYIAGRAVELCSTCTAL